MIKKIIYSIALILFINTASNAQFTIGGHYLAPTFDSWNKALTFKQGDPRYIYTNGFGLDVGYWFKLKNIRIEFTPQLEYRRYNQKVKGENILSSKNNEVFSTQTMGLSLLTNIYFLDIRNECDCPTISKDGNIFKKGLFVFLGPSVGYNLNNYKYTRATDNTDSSIKFDGLTFGGRIGMGFDVGISKWVTITPMFSYSYYFQNEWEGLSQAIYTDNNEVLSTDMPDLSLDKSNLGLFSFGVRALFELDNLYKYTRHSYR